MKVRVLHINSPLGLAGAERVLLTYLDGHDRNKVEVFVASYLNHRRLSNTFTQEMETRGIPFVKVPLSETGIFSPVRETARVVRRHRINVIHSHGYRADVTGLLASIATGVRIVSTVHGWTPVSRKLRTYEALDRFCLRFFDQVFCVSSLILKDLAAAGVAGKKLVHLPNGVSRKGEIGKPRDIRQEWGIGGDEIIIMFAGRLSPEKGLHFLLQACAELFAKWVKVKLLLVGDGPLRNHLEDTVSRRGMSDRVIFCGHQEDIHHYYAGADLFVLPSLTEGLPMVLLEALQAGLPVVCSRVGGIPDVVCDGETGILVAPGDVKELANGISRLLCDPDLAERLGRNGRRRVESSFGAEAWVRRIEEVYSSLAFGLAPLKET